MKKVLITGVAGFIGLHLAERLLNEGFEVWGVDNFSRGESDQDFHKLLSNPQFHFFKYDLCNGIPIELNFKFDFTYHLSGIVGVENVLSAPFDVFQNNLKMIFNILDHQRLFPSGSFTYLSSSEAYGWGENNIIPTPENIPLIAPNAGVPRGGYALSKINGEYLTALVCKEAAIPFSILRPHNIYGPRMGNSHVIPQLWSKFLNSKLKTVITNSESTRAFCFIDDAIEQIIQSSRSPINGVENVGDDTTEISMINLARLMADIMNQTNELDSNDLSTDPFPRRCPDMNFRRSRFTNLKVTPLSLGLKKTLDWYNHRQ